MPHERLVTQNASEIESANSTYVRVRQHDRGLLTNNDRRWKFSDQSDKAHATLRRLTIRLMSAAAINALLSIPDKQIANDTPS